MEGQLGLEQEVTLGLIINELVTNSIKYAFPDGAAGEIFISLKPVYKKNYELIVKDNGAGIPDDISLDNSETMGIYLVKIMAEDQLNGKIEITGREGTCTRITFESKLKDS